MVRQRIVSREALSQGDIQKLIDKEIKLLEVTKRPAANGRIEFDHIIEYNEA